MQNILPSSWQNEIVNTAQSAAPALVEGALAVAGINNPFVKGAATSVVINSLQSLKDGGSNNPPPPTPNQNIDNSGSSNMNNMFGNIFGSNQQDDPIYKTDQVNQQAAQNQANVRNASNAAVQQGMKDLAQRGMLDLALLQRGLDLQGSRQNAAANSSTARRIAEQAQNQLNMMYADAGNRLNTAAANTQSAIANAGSTLASLFR